MEQIEKAEKIINMIVNLNGKNEDYSDITNSLKDYLKNVVLKNNDISLKESAELEEL